MLPGATVGRVFREAIERNTDMPVISKFYGIVIGQGDAPCRVRSMVMEWTMQHQRELLKAWSRLGRAQGAQPIEPLV